MQFPSAGTTEERIDLTPLIDVVLLILIFILVSAKFIETSSIDIALPETGAPADRSTDRAMIVDIGAAGTLAINGIFVEGITDGEQTESLSELFEQESAGDLKAIIYIRADARAPHGSVVLVLDTAQRNGYSRVRFAVSPRQ